MTLWTKTILRLRKSKFFKVKCPHFVYDTVGIQFGQWIIDGKLAKSKVNECSNWDRTGSCSNKSGGQFNWLDLLRTEYHNHRRHQHTFITISTSDLNKHTFTIMTQAMELVAVECFTKVLSFFFFFIGFIERKSQHELDYAGSEEWRKSCCTECW